MANIPFLNNAYFADKVGIGPNKTSPAVPLDVDGKIRSNDDTSGDYLEIFNDGSVSGQSFITTTSNELVLAPQNGVLRVQGENFGSGNNASMEIYDALNAAVKVKLNSSGASYFNGGNVGIGKTSPGVRLDVIGSIRSSNEFLLRSGTTDIGSIRNQGGALDIRGDSTRDVSLGSVTSPQALFVEGTNGRVGIGINGTYTTPPQKLTVVSDDDIQAVAQLYNIGNGGGLFVRTDGTTRPLFELFSASSYKFVVKGTGLVGIGVTNPTYKLDVRSDGNLFYGETLLNNNTSVFRLKGNGGASSLFEVKADGLVGIGTTSPGAKLDVAGNINVTGNLTATQGVLAQYGIFAINSSAWASVVATSTINNGGGIRFGTNTYAGSNAGTDFAVRIGGNGSFYNKFTVDSTGAGTFGGTIAVQGTGNSYFQGNVGIGTTNPEGKLHIAESVDNTTGLKFTTTTGGSNDEVNLHFQGTATTAPFYISRKNTGGAEIQLQQDGDIILNGSNGDNVGIGTTSPNASSILEVFSVTKGVLLPRMTTTQVNAIASPINGLTVYNTTLNTLCFYNGSSWQKVSHTNM